MTHYKIFTSSAVVFFISNITRFIIGNHNFFSPVVNVIGSISVLVMLYYTGFVIAKFLERYYNDETSE